MILPGGAGHSRDRTCGGQLAVARRSGKAAMSFTRVIAQANVSDLERAVAWYSILFDGEPDARPMDGLVEWRLGDAMGVQVWSDAERAGRSSMVLDASDLDALATRLGAVGIDHPGIQAVTASRILQLEDPDGNTVVVTGA